MNQPAFITAATTADEIGKALADPTTRIDFATKMRSVQSGGIVKVGPQDFTVVGVVDLQKVAKQAK